MRILLTGNNGYIGTVLTNELIKRKYEIVGFDIDYFYDCNLIETNSKLIKHIKKDIRKIIDTDLEEIDVVIHLAGLANDPLGELNPRLTKEINFNSTLSLAEICKKKGIQRFIYASSQSMYGISDSTEELDEDKLIKIMTEPKNALIKQFKALFKMDDIEIEFKNDSLRQIAKLAVDQNTGARGLRTIIEDTLMDLMYTSPDHKDLEKIIISKDVVIKDSEPLLIFSNKPNNQKILANNS